MSRLIFGSIAVLTLVLGALGAVGYAKYRQIQASSSMPPQPEMPVAVAMEPAVAAPFRQSSVTIGTLLAAESVTLRNELTGVVTKVAVRPGDVVKQGDVLVRLDSELEEAELRSALATKRLADASLQRNKRLIQSGAGSEQLLEQASADASRAIAEIERLNVLIEKKTLAAPFDARVGLFDLHPGQYLPVGTRITELSGISNYINIDFSMPQSVATNIKVGDEVELIAQSLPQPIQSEIIATDAAANQQSRSLMARARIDHPPETLRPGDSIKVRIPYGPLIPAVTVPSTAVRRGPTGTGVFVAVESDNQTRARYRPITVLGSRGALTWIAEGVDADDPVVTDGSFKVAEGTLLAAGPPAAEAGAEKPALKTESSEGAGR